MRKRSVNVAIVGNCYYDEIWKVLNILGVKKKLVLTLSKKDEVEVRLTPQLPLED